jgi:hypothetical protein
MRHGGMTRASAEPTHTAWDEARSTALGQVCEQRPPGDGEKGMSAAKRVRAPGQVGKSRVAVARA